MGIKVVRYPISRKELIGIAKNQYGNLVKAVVDVARGIMAIGGELHSDGEAILLEQGSSQSDLWGINFYPEKSGEDWIEFDSVINLRPSLGNNSRSVEDGAIRDKIMHIVSQLVKPA